MWQLLKFGGLFVALLSQHTSAFSLYPTVDPGALASALNISTGCLDALNSSVACDNYLFGWTNFVDDHWWSADNLTTLCTSTCTASAQSWMENVFMSCLSDTLVVYGKAIPADTVAGRYTDGLNVACLQSSSSDWCMIESLNWVGSDVIRPDCNVDPTDPSCSNPANVSAANQRIANLYNDTILCSDCFVKLFYERLGSDFLPDSDHSDYLVEQFQDIQDVCSTTVGAVSTRGFLPYPPSTPTPMLVNITAPNPNTTTSLAPSSTAPSSTLPSPTSSSIVTPTPTHGTMVSNCDSFYYAQANDDCYDIALNHNITLLDFDTWNPAVGTDCSGLWADYYYCVGLTLDTTSGACQMIDTVTGVSSSDDFTACNQLAVLYNVPTGSLMSITGAPGCYSQSDVCVPAPCNLLNVTEGATCTSLVAEMTANSTIGDITVTQLLSWNPFLLGTCDNVTAGQQICTEASGGAYIPPPAANATSGAGGEERGGPGGADPTAVTGTSVSYLITSQPLGSNPTAAPAPTPAGISSSCNQYAQVAAGNDCTSFASNNNITPTQLYSWNAILSDGGSNCNTELWVGYYYCVGTIGQSSVSATTTTSSPTSTSVSAPGATQTGIISTCNAFAQAPSGSYCSLFASSNSISLSELYQWNTVLGSSGEYCSTEFWALEYYCVGISAPPAADMQAGILSSCNNWAAAPAGSYCSLFASENNITLDDLYAWNAVLGADGANCGSQFWAGEYYCVGVTVAASSSTTTTTTTTTAVAAPGPTQTGIISTCDGYAQAPSGSYCSLFASDNGITLDELYAWNTVLGSNGENCGTEFWSEEYYCVGAS